MVVVYIKLKNERNEMYKQERNCYQNYDISINFNFK